MKAAIVIAFLFGVLLGLILRRFVSSADPVSEEEAKKKAQAAAATTPLKAQFFSDCNFGGKIVELGIGKYPNAEAIGAKNDDISSIKVPKGLSVTIYEDNDFKGRSKQIKATGGPAELACLTSYNMKGTKTWNDQVSSIYIAPL